MAGMEEKILLLFRLFRLLARHLKLRINKKKKKKKGLDALIERQGDDIERGKKEKKLSA